MLRQHRILSVLTAAACLCGSAVHADTIVLDQGDGAIFDSVLDGAIIPPPPSFGTVPANGVPDSQGQPLSIALVSGGIEQRGIGEFPLAPLAGMGSEDIVSATLTFNIDDVIGSFWPHSGATFSDNAAAQSIAVFAYDGDGVVQLADFGNVIGAPAGVVDTFTPHGVITDATLGVSGALLFTVDVTSQIQDLLDDSATHVGIVWATSDAGTGTSLDNLGVSGAQMPSITVNTVVYEPPVFDSAQRSCQKAIGLYGRKFASAVHTHSQTCFNRVIKDVALAKPLTNAAAACAKALDLGAAPASKIDKARAKAVEKILAKCVTPLTPASVNSPCDLAALTFTDVANCVLDHNFDQAQEMLRAEFANACGIATAVGLHIEYPVVCAAP